MALPRASGRRRSTGSSLPERPNEASKLGRAPTLVVASAKLTGDEYQNREDVLATACATYIVLLAAHARGLASYWRTPALLETPEGRAAVGLPDDEEFVALIHLGRPVDLAAREGAQAGHGVPRVPALSRGRSMRARGVEPPRA